MSLCVIFRLQASTVKEKSPRVAPKLWSPSPKKKKKEKTHKKWRLIKHVREDVCLSVGIFARFLGFKRGETAS